MQKFLPIKKPARPENHILVSLDRMQRTRVDQGLTPFNAMPYEEDFLQPRLHGICFGEMQVMEAVGRTMFDFPDAPWEFQLDMARQVWDESCNTEIYMKLLDYIGAYLGGFPESEVLRACAQIDYPACRAAGINRGLEGLACDVFDQLIRIPQRNDDGSPVTISIARARSVSYIQGIAFGL